MFAADSRMNKRNVYHLICRVISICLCALFCLFLPELTAMQQLHRMLGCFSPLICSVTLRGLSWPEK